MWQKLSPALALGAVFSLTTAVLFVQKTDLGIHTHEAQILPSIASDPTSRELFSAKSEPQKSLSAQIEPKKARASKPEVASLTSYKPEIKNLAPENLEAKIRQYAAEYGANPEVMILIAKCESGFNNNAISPSGAYKGMYQFVASTWQSNRRAMGLSEDLNLMYDAEEAIKTAAFKMGRDGYGAWPVCSQKAFNVLATR